MYNYLHVLLALYILVCRLLNIKYYNKITTTRGEMYACQTCKTLKRKPISVLSKQTLLQQ